jgi:hypothetical protein
MSETVVSLEVCSVSSRVSWHERNAMKSGTLKGRTQESRTPKRDSLCSLFMSLAWLTSLGIQAEKLTSRDTSHSIQVMPCASGIERGWRVSSLTLLKEKSIQTRIFFIPILLWMSSVSESSFRYRDNDPGSFILLDCLFRERLFL